MKVLATWFARNQGEFFGRTEAQRGFFYSFHSGRSAASRLLWRRSPAEATSHDPGDCCSPPSHTCVPLPGGSTRSLSVARTNDGVAIHHVHKDRCEGKLLIAPAMLPLRRRRPYIPSLPLHVTQYAMFSLGRTPHTLHCAGEKHRIHVPHRRIPSVSTIPYRSLCNRSADDFARRKNPSTSTED